MQYDTLDDMTTLDRGMRHLAQCRYAGDMTMTALQGVIPEWTVGDRLRKAREAAGIGVQEMAEDFGVNRRTIGRYENDQAMPTRATLLAYQMRTGVPIEWILKGEEGVGSTPPPAGEVHPPGLEPGTHCFPSSRVIQGPWSAAA